MRVRLLLISPDAVLRESAKMEAQRLPLQLEVASTPQYAESLFADAPDRPPQAVLIHVPDGDPRAIRHWARTSFPRARLFVLLPSHQPGAQPLSALESEDLAGSGPDVVLSIGDRSDGIQELLEQFTGRGWGDEGDGVRSAGGAETPRLDELIGRSVPFREALELALKAAADPLAPVLIVGEKGTGKRLFARAIHSESPHATGPFTRVDCRAANARELDAALAGEGGAQGSSSSGARPSGHPGTAGGTLFLEEVTALDLGRQAKVIAFLDQHRRGARLQREGADLGRRLIASTAQDPDAAVQAGTLRADLLSRVDNYRIVLPALRERPSDILLLAERFLSGKATSGRRAASLSRQVQEQLLANPWPGNIRELFGVLEAALDEAGDGGEIEPRHLPDWLTVSDREPSRAGSSSLAQESVPPPNPGGAQVIASPGNLVVHLPEEGIAFEEIERAILKAALELSGNNVVRAARLLRLGRGSLRYRLEKYKLVEPRRRRPAKRRAPQKDRDIDRETLRKAS